MSDDMMPYVNGDGFADLIIGAFCANGSSGPPAFAGSLSRGRRAHPGPS